MNANGQATVAGVSLRLLTINVHKGFNRGFVLHELREAIRATTSDLVFLQEVLGAHRRHALRHLAWPKQPQYEFLADSIWPQYAYGRNAVYPDGDHGNALLSKYPITQHDNIDVSIGHYERRGLLHCQLSIPGVAVDVHTIVAHLSLRERQRHAQANQLVDYVERFIPTDSALIVAGDFNDWRERLTPLFAQIKLRDSFVEHHGNTAKTFPARWPILRLDRIYVRNLHLRDAAILNFHPWSHLSDHVPLFAEVSA